MKYKQAIRNVFILALILLSISLTGIVLFQRYRINNLRVGIRKMDAQKVLRNKNYVANIYLPIPASYGFLKDTIYRNKLIYFYNASSCSSCDKVMEHISGLTDNLIKKATIVVINNYNNRDVRILQKKLGKHITVKGITEYDFFIEHSFLCYINSENKIISQYIPIPYDKNYVSVFLEYIREKLSFYE